MTASGRGSAVRLCITALLVLLVALMGSSGVAQAHALLLRSQPNADAILPHEPPVIHLWFSEDLNGSLSKAIVWDHNRREVDLRNYTVSNGTELTVALRPGLPDGTYLVLWTSVSSQDGHVLKRAFLFSIGHRGPAPRAPSLGGNGSQNFPPDLEATVGLLARAIELAGSALWLGLVLYLTLMAPSAGASPDELYLKRSARGLTLGWIPATLGALFLSRLVTLIIQANTLTGNWPATFSATTFRGLLLETEYGHLWIAMQAAVVVALLGCGLRLILRPGRAGSGARTMAGESSTPGAAYGFVLPVPRLPRSGPAVGMLFLLALVEAYLLAASGHAATVNLGDTGAGILTVPVAIDWLHVVASGFWVGGILAGSLILIPALRTAGTRGLPPFLDVLDRFSPFAYASVLILILTGGFNGKVHTPSWDAINGSVYGRTLIVKILIVGLMIVISAFTVRVVRPRLRRCLASSSARNEPAIAFLQAILIRWLRIGAVLGCAVFLATAVLNAYPVPPTFGAPSGPFSLTGRSGSIQVTLRLNPGRAGPNTFTVVLSRRHRPVPLADVRILETILDMNMGTQFVILNEVGPGLFRGPGEVAMGGHWQFEVLVRLPNRLNEIPLFFRSTVSD